MIWVTILSGRLNYLHSLGSANLAAALHADLLDAMLEAGL